MTVDAAHMRAYYAARAGEYDKVYLKPEHQFELRAIEQWLPPLFAGAWVLELACGTGYWTKFVADVAAHVVALDATPETLSSMHLACSRADIRHEARVTCTMD